MVLGCLLTLHGLTPEDSPAAYKVQLTNVLLLVFVRFPPCIYSMVYILITHSIRNPLFWTNWIGIFIYTRYEVRMIVSISKRLQLIQLVPSKPAQIRLFQSYSVSIYTIFFSLASSSQQS